MRSVVKYVFECTICPPRATYDPDNTVSAMTCECGDVIERHKVEFLVDDHLKLMGSLWTMRTSNNVQPTCCCIYLHSLGTNQFEVLNIVPLLCNSSVAVFGFDFPGCGISEGDAIPLDGNGFKVVLAAKEHLKTHFQIREFAIWGRSMGAAIALHTVSVSNEFNCCIADSSFETTKRIVLDQARENHIPQVLVRMAYPVFRKYAREFAGMDIDSPFPLEFVSQARTPLLMGHGLRDTFVPPHHSRHIYDRYGYKVKQLYMFPGKHNSTRPARWYEAAGRFIYRYFGIPGWFRQYVPIYTTTTLHIGEINIVLEDIDRMRRYRAQHTETELDVAEGSSAAQEPEESSAEEPYNELQTFTDAKDVVYP